MFEHPRKMELNWRKRAWPERVDETQFAKSFWMVNPCRPLPSGVHMCTYNWPMLLQ